MKLKLQSIMFLSCLLITTFCYSQTRYLDEVFCDVETIEDVVYGNNVTILPLLQGGLPGAEDLEMDIYMPAGDTANDRPVILMLHTGSFLPAIANGQATGDKTDNAIMEQCRRFAQKGYVAIAVNYRLGWNPISQNEDVRRSTLIQGAYRSLQDVRTAVRFLRKSIVEEGNPYGITDKFVAGGLGSGGYIALAAATLWNYEEELLLAKFMDTSQDINGDGVPDAVPYIIPEFFGNLEGTDTGILPGMDVDGDGVFDVTDIPMCLPNHVGFSSEIDMAFNVGGALPDSSWLDAGEVPIASMQCWNETFAPYGVGDVIVPTTGDFVLEAMGSLIVQEMAEEFGNNAVFEGMSIELDDSWYGFGSGFENSATAGHESYPGLFPMVTPDPSTDLTPCGPYTVQGAPWDWWDNDLYGAIADVFQDTEPGTMGCLSLLDNPDMSEEKGMAYADLMQQFFAPRIVAALGLDGETLSMETIFNTATSNENINEYFSMALTLAANDFQDLSICPGGFTMFAPGNDIDDSALIEIFENGETPLSEILSHYIHANASLNSNDLTDGMELTMMDGNNVTITIGENVMINDATITNPDIVSLNGVIHIIDGLLFAESSNIIEENLQYSIFPNPSNGEINITTLENNVYNVKIINTLGDVIFIDKLTGNKTFDLNKYGKGIYLIELSNDYSINTQKVIIK